MTKLNNYLDAQQSEEDMQSEMVKAQYIESFTPQELMYNKKVKKVIEALELISASGKMYKLGELVPYGCEPLGTASKALAEWKAEND